MGEKTSDNPFIPCISCQGKAVCCGVATCAFCLSMNITLISLLGLHGCTLCFPVHVPSSPRQNLSWLLEPKGGRGPQSSIRPLSLSRLDPPVITISHYTMMKRPTTGYWSVFSVGTGGVQRGCAMGGGREEVSHSWRQMSSLLLNTERLVTPPNTNTDTRRYAARQLQRHMLQSTVCARRESSDLYAGWGKRLYSGALTLRLTCQSQSPGDLSFS